MRELLLSSRELQRIALRYGIILIFSTTIATAINSRKAPLFNSRRLAVNSRTLQRSIHPLRHITPVGTYRAARHIALPQAKYRVPSGTYHVALRQEHIALR